MIRYLLPVTLFVALAVVLALGLGTSPRLAPSSLIGKALPDFQLDRLREPGRSIGTGDLKGKVSLLNVWATWCVSCRQEHEVLMRISRDTDTPIFGLNYKDSRKDALRWLTQLGDPYVANAVDPRGTVGLDLGVYGAPETYVVDSQGLIAYKHIGPLTEPVWRETLAPLIRSLKGDAG